MARVNKAKLAAERRASMAAELAESFIASGETFSCDARLMRHDATYDLAVKLAREAIGEGLAFGNSQSKRDPRHVADLCLYDACRIISAKLRAERLAA